MFNKKAAGLLFFFLLVFWPRITVAHGQKYFEFAPDYFASQGLIFSSFSEANELFLPQNDFLGGLDLWLDNAGETTGLTLTLLDIDGQSLFSQTTNPGYLEPVAGGEKIHFDFPQIPVQADQLYRLKISSSSSDLQIYYADRIKVLAHNAAIVSQYLNGAAEVSGEEKEFSFKFALYESSEKKPPAIYNLETDFLSSAQTRLKFNASEAVDFKLQWGLRGQSLRQAANYTGELTLCLKEIDFCQISLTTQAGQTYSYQLTVKDSWGNEAAAEGEFQTPAVVTPSVFIPTPSFFPSILPSTAPDLTPPVISGLKITEITPRSVEVAWQTDKPANSNLLISFTTEKLTLAAVTDSTLELEHLLFSGFALEPATPYTLTVTSRDFWNNTASLSLPFVTAVLPSPLSSLPIVPSSPLITPISSADSETTGALSEINPLSLVEVQSEFKAESGSGSAVISWETIAETASPAGYRVDVFDENFQWKQTFNLSPETKKITIENLPPGKYQVIVYAQKDGKFKKIAPPVFFVIKPSFSDRLFALWPWLAGPLIVLLLWVYRRAQKWEGQKKANLPQATS